MVNILFYSDKFNVAGTETFIMNVIRNSDRNNFHFDVLTCQMKSNRYIHEAEKLGCTFYRLTPRRHSFIEYYKQLNAFFNENGSKYQVIHWCGGDLSSIEPVFFAMHYGIKVRIIHGHNSSCSGLHTRLLHFINKGLLNLACNVKLSCSSSASTFFFGHSGSEVMKNGINIEDYRYNLLTREKNRNELGIEPGINVIGNVARFEEVKNHIFLLKIFAFYHNKYGNAHLILVGNGSLFESMKIKAMQLGISEHVSFLGERDDVNRLLQAMDCFVMPSLYEGLPFVLVEAQASSLPCVISDTINKDAAISPLVNFLNLNDNIENWVEAIHNSLDLKDRGNKEHFVKDSGYSITNTVSILEKIYSDGK